MSLRVTFVLLILSVVPAALWADQVTLKNGDRVSGSIVKKDGDKLTISTAYFGTVTLPWDQVDMLTTDIPAYLQLAGATTEEGTLNASGGQVTITPLSGGTRSVSIGDVQAIRSNAEQAAYNRLQDPAWYELWAGAANLGWAGPAGNARTNTFTIASLASRPTRTDKTSLYFSAVSASALVAGTTWSTARALRGGWAYQRNITPRIFGDVFNDYEYDRFQSLDLRFVLGAGAGYHLVDNERTKLDVLAGLDYQRAKFSTPLTRNALEFNWGDEFDHKLNGTITLVQRYRMFNSLTDSPNFRVNFDLGSLVRIADWLTWNVTLSDRYLRNPVPGRLKNDVLYSTGLGVRFGRQ